MESFMDTVGGEREAATLYLEGRSLIPGTVKDGERTTFTQYVFKKKKGGPR